MPARDSVVLPTGRVATLRGTMNRIFEEKMDPTSPWGRNEECRDAADDVIALLEEMIYNPTWPRRLTAPPGHYGPRSLRMSVVAFLEEFGDTIDLDAFVAPDPPAGDDDEEEFPELNVDWDALDAAVAAARPAPLQRQVAGGEVNHPGDPRARPASPVTVMWAGESTAEQ